MLEANLETARGRLAVKSKQLEEAVPHYERAIALLELAGAVNNDPEMQLAPVYQQLGRQADADTLLAKIAKQMPSRKDPVAAQPMKALDALQQCNIVNMKSADLAKMRDQCQRALGTIESEFGIGSQLAAMPHGVVALTSELLDDWAAARAEYLLEAKIFETLGGTDKLAEALEGAGRTSYELHDYIAAADYYKHCSDVLQKAAKSIAESSGVFCRSGHGRSLVAAGQVDDGIADLEWALPRFEIMPDPPKNAIARARLALADGLWQRNHEGDRAAARVMAAKAKEAAIANRTGLSGDDGMNPTYKRRADTILAAVESWIASHRR